MLFQEPVILLYLASDCGYLPSRSPGLDLEQQASMWSASAVSKHQGCQDTLLLGTVGSGGDGFLCTSVKVVWPLAVPLGVPQAALQS